ncbi:hypothetical protein [Xanthomonas fragariae]|uniref:hypothetical protein n=1 Tax=Xanthomonas fragariae TaxID=48664 RepID=UPI001EE00A29|nr:hypothetical protein [Xanthomonas fragariae]
MKVTIDQTYPHGVAQIFYTRRYTSQCFRVASQGCSPIGSKLYVPQFGKHAKLIITDWTAAMCSDSQ